MLSSISTYVDFKYGLTFGEGFSEQGISGIIINLATILPSIAVGVRRLHDIGKSGWWILLPLTIIGIFVIIYWAVQVSEDDNEYGKNPLIVD